MTSTTKAMTVAWGMLMVTGGLSSVSFSAELAVRVSTKAADPDGTLTFATEELKLLTDKTQGSERLTFVLSVDERLPPFSFRIDRQGEAVSLTGKAPAETLCAAYTVLQQMGFRFEVTGPVKPRKLDLQKVPANSVITPTITRRGIRQHINFNMDVSGYPLAEAKEYIRNLARLRYNYISFHSYPCHWTRDRYANAAVFSDFTKWMKAVYNPRPSDVISGGYFYGAEFRIPNHPLVRPRVRYNKEYFCVPEFENVIHTQPERARRAQAWLRELMREAKRCGMMISLSTEPKIIDDQYNQELAERVVCDYPMITFLEFNSQEGGDPKDPDARQVNQVMAEEIVTATVASPSWKSSVNRPTSPTSPRSSSGPMAGRSGSATRTAGELGRRPIPRGHVTQ